MLSSLISALELFLRLNGAFPDDFGRFRPQTHESFGLIERAAEAQGQEKNACDGFKWSVARERGWFAAGVKPAATGAAIAPEQGYAVTLQPNDSVAFPVPPERALKAGGFGATLNLADVGKPGLYQITISDEAWLDVIQDGALVKSTAFSGQKDCPGVRKTVRFEMKSGPATIQLSNAAGASINLVFAAAR
jgi:hypothetical protein